MAALITRTRSLISDPNPPASGTSIFNDDQVQEALDRTRLTVRYLPLYAVPTYLPAGQGTAYLDFYASEPPETLGDWETDVQLVDRNWVPLTPASSDLVQGQWTFSPGPTGFGQQRPVWLNGKTYDCHTAAADLLRQWAAKLKLKVDLKSGDQTVALSQRAKSLLHLAHECERKRRRHTIQLTRSDANLLG